MFPIEVFRNTLDKLVSILREQKIPFHLTGGVTSIAYSEPRMTQDIDIVVSNQKISNKIEQVIESLEGSDFLFDEASVRAAVEQQKMFQLLDTIESLKFDIYPRELIKGELERSDSIELFDGVYYPIACRTDTAIAKLLWIDQGSHKSRRDLRHLFQNASRSIQGEIERLAEQHGKLSLLREVLIETDEIDL